MDRNRGDDAQEREVRNTYEHQACEHRRTIIGLTTHQIFENQNQFDSINRD